MAVPVQKNWDHRYTQAWTKMNWLLYHDSVLKTPSISLFVSLESNADHIFQFVHPQHPDTLELRGTSLNLPLLQVYL